MRTTLLSLVFLDHRRNPTQMGSCRITGKREVIPSKSS
jgi:hypothetical protein